MDARIEARIADLNRRHEAGDYAAALPEAEALYSEIVEAGIPASDPRRGTCVELLALLRNRRGAVAEALALARREAGWMAEAGVHLPRLLMALSQLEIQSGNVEGAFDAARRAEAACGGRPEAAACAAMQARWHTMLGDLTQAQRCLERADTFGEDLAPSPRAALLQARAEFTSARRGFERAEPIWEQVLAHAQRHDMPTVEAAALDSLGQAAWRRGDRPLAVLRFSEQRGIHRCLDYDMGVAAASNNLGELHRELGELDEARACYEEALASIAEGDRDVWCAVETNLGLVILEAGDFAAAAAAFADVLAQNPGRPVVRVIACIGQVPARARDHDWAAVDDLLSEAGHWLLEVTAVDDDLLKVARRVANEIVAAAIADDHRGRALRLLAMAHDWCVRFERQDDARRLLYQIADVVERGAPGFVGPFTLMARLGEGASSRVWRAQHEGGGFVVALKVLKKGDTHPRVLHNELAAVARLDHPNIVYLLHYGMVTASAAACHPDLEAGAPWIAMEHVAGGTISDVEGRLPWTSCRVVLLALLDALAHAHARGVLHLDLKPANVLLEGARGGPIPKLADFGLARFLGGPHRERIAGSPGYMAPEQFVSGQALTPQTDLYALGCLATALLQGAPPYEAGTVEALRDAHTNRPIPDLQPTVPVPSGLQGWLRRLLAKSVGARFQSAAEAAQALRALPERADVPASREAPRTRAAPSWSAITLVLDEPAPQDPPTQPLPAVAPAPPLPVGWRRGTAPPRPPDVVEAGLGLFGLRAARLTGREGVRDVLWSELRDVDVSGRSRVLFLLGAPGVGCRAIAQWLVERAAELGAPPGLVQLAPSPVALDATEWELKLLGDPALHVAVLHDDTLPRDLLSAPWAVPVWLDPLPAHELERCLDEWLPLGRDLRDELVKWANGRPGAAMAQLKQWVADHRLTRRSHGWVLRPGTRWPS